MVFTLNLTLGGKIEKSWHVERSTSESGGSGSVQLIQNLIDDAIFEMIYDLRYNDGEDKTKWAKVFGPTEAPKKQLLTSPAAVAAYYRARTHFTRYFAHQSLEDLDLAKESLEILQTFVHDAETFLMLGMILAERREETAAILAYERALEILENTHPSNQKQEYRTKLLVATAWGQQFKPNSNHQALLILKEIENKLPEPSNADVEDLELSAHIQAQLALIYGRYLAFLRHAKVVDIFGEDAPERLQLTSKEIYILKDTESKLEKKRQVVRGKVKQLWLEHLKSRELANDLLEKLKSSWKNSKALDLERRLSNLEFQIHLASGYAEYRLTAWLSPTHSEEDNLGAFTEFDPTPPKLLTFEEHCEEAITSLRAADRVNPGHYFVMQYLGLIHADPRYDSEHRYENVARRYLEKSVKVNPRAYYGYQQLAKLSRRRVSRLGLVSDLKKDLEQARNNAKHAIDLRHSDRASHKYRAELTFMLWKLETGAEKSKQLEREFREHLQVAKRLNPPILKHRKIDPHLHWIEVIDDIPQLSQSATKALNALSEFVESDSAEAEEKFKNLKKLCDQSKNHGETVASEVNDLIAHCDEIELTWLSAQYRYDRQQVKAKAEKLRDSLLAALKISPDLGEQSEFKEVEATLRDSLEKIISLSIPWTSEGSDD